MLKSIALTLILCWLISIAWCLNRKLPVYVGAGYDLARGNPKENEIDSGFRQQIFELKYDERVSTEDGRFLVPDDMITRDLEYCSYQPTTKEYTGVNSYQADLKSIASPSRFSQSLIVAGSFSANPTYKAMQKATKNGDSIFIETSSKCETYSLQLQSTRPALSRLFESDVIEAFTNLKSWETVFNKYGTHYVTYAIYGAHVISTYKFKRAPYQFLKGKNLNISEIATMKFSNSLSQGGLKSKDIALFNNSIEQTTESVIGARSPNSQESNVWKNVILINPVPIEYRLSSILELFQQINFLGLDSQKIETMKGQFYSAVNEYSIKLKCSQPTPDLPLPPAIRFQVTKSIKLGGSRGNDFEDKLPEFNPDFTVRRVLIRADSFLFSIQFVFSDETKTREHGKLMKSEKIKEWKVPNDQYIKAIILGYQNKAICSIRFETNSGEKSNMFGNNCGGMVKKIELKGQLFGMYGTESDKINSIGFLSYETVTV